ncbi:MAG: MarR family transcriptional regulator [Actinobacteria bacterium]|nr:MarR family transcriptional regulator [Actinomycetota bacterium]MCL5447352.1 MarR family transcriptional regulator [Actinomycetota bacterium]
MATTNQSNSKSALTDEEFQRLLELRTSLKQYLRWNEHAAKDAGITPAQHELLIAIKGHPGQQGPSISNIAQYLLLRHHSAVGLVDRAEKAGLLIRKTDGDDRRVVRLRLSPKANRVMDKLAALHSEELARLSTKGQPLWKGLA